MPTLNDYEYYYRGLTVGGTTGFDVMREEGIMGLEVRSADRAYPRAHGQIPGQHYMDGKYIDIDFAMHTSSGTTALAVMVEALNRAFTTGDYTEPDEDVDALHFKYPGWTQQFIRCRPVKKTRIRTPQNDLGVVPMSVQLFAYDPRRYTSEEFDSGVRDGTFSVTAYGTMATYPQITFVLDGSGDAKLTNNTNGDVLEIDGGSAGGTLQCRMDRYSYGSREMIIYQGYNDYYTKWVLPRTPFKLEVGSNSLTLNSGTSVRVRHHGTYA